jgi:hypothetical protein
LGTGREEPKEELILRRENQVTIHNKEVGQNAYLPRLVCVSTDGQQTRPTRTNIEIYFRNILAVHIKFYQIPNKGEYYIGQHFQKDSRDALGLENVMFCGPARFTGGLAECHLFAASVCRA